MLLKWINETKFGAKKENISEISAEWRSLVAVLGFSLKKGKEKWWEEKRREYKGNFFNSVLWEEKIKEEKRKICYVFFGSFNLTAQLQFSLHITSKLKVKVSVTKTLVFSLHSLSLSAIFLLDNSTKQVGGELFQVFCSPPILSLLNIVYELLSWGYLAFSWNLTYVLQVIEYDSFFYNPSYLEKIGSYLIFYPFTNSLFIQRKVISDKLG